MSGTHQSDEGSDVDIEEVEVLNPVDLSIEEAFQSDNVQDNFQGDLGRDISVESDEHYGDNQDNAIDQTASGSDTDHLDEEDNDDTGDVIDNPNDLVSDETEEEGSIVVNQDWITIGASSSNQNHQNNQARRQKNASTPTSAC